MKYTIEELKTMYDSFEKGTIVLDEFNSRFSIEILNQLNDNELAERFFNWDNSGLFYWLQNSKESLALGSSHENSTFGIKRSIDTGNYELYYYPDKRKETKAQLITLEESEALEYAIKVKSFLNSIISTAKECLSGDLNVNNYIDLSQRIKDITNQNTIDKTAVWYWDKDGKLSMLIRKYLFCSFPDCFSCAFSIKMANRVIERLRITNEPDGSDITIKSGIISMFAKENFNADNFNFNRFLYTNGYYDDNKKGIDNNSKNVVNDNNNMITIFFKAKNHSELKSYNKAMGGFEYDIGKSLPKKGETLPNCKTTIYKGTPIIKRHNQKKNDLSDETKKIIEKISNKRKDLKENGIINKDETVFEKEYTGFISPNEAGKFIFYRQANIYDEFSFSTNQEGPWLTREEFNEQIKKGIVPQPEEPKNGKNPRNIILYGPPGTGKTYNSAIFAVKLIDTYDTLDEIKAKIGHDGYQFKDVKERYDILSGKGKPKEEKEKSQIGFITFHQSYGYEEFIEGIKPVMKDKNGKDLKEPIYDVVPGVFKKFCKEANKQENKCKKYVFIIDEINRGNISKIFGELITLIEDSKRDGKNEKMEVTLPYSGESFSIPDNVYILGTMNTADRSIAMMDTALRRRFQFIEMMPEPDILEKDDDEQELIIKGINIKQMLKRINDRIEVLYDREHTIGHAYFCDLKKNKDDKDNHISEDDKFKMLANTFRNKIIPLLQEYFYDDYEKIRLVLGDNQKEGTLDKLDKSNKEELKDDISNAYKDNDKGGIGILSFIKKKEKAGEGLFGDNNDYNDIPTYSINDDKAFENKEKSAFERPESYIGIYDINIFKDKIKSPNGDTSTGKSEEQEEADPENEG